MAALFPGWVVPDHCAVSTSPFDQTRLFEFAIGASNRATGQAEVGSELADRGQSVVRTQDADGDKSGDLLPDLFVGRHG
ncbi:hypothetical protein GCM10029964_067620 [Kibdelosporangium lantanae]